MMSECSSLQPPARRGRRSPPKGRVALSILADCHDNFQMRLRHLGQRRRVLRGDERSQAAARFSSLPARRGCAAQFDESGAASTSFVCFLRAVSAPRHFYDNSIMSRNNFSTGRGPGVADRVGSRAGRRRDATPEPRTKARFVPQSPFWPAKISFTVVSVDSLGFGRLARPSAAR